MSYVHDTFRLLSRSQCKQESWVVVAMLMQACHKES